MRLDLDKSTLLKVHVSQDNLRALFDAQVVHHPDWDMAHAFLSREFEHTAVSLDSHLGVRDHEGHGVLDAQTCEFVERRCWQDDYKAQNRKYAGTSNSKVVTYFYCLY